jgi:hypothetical protein
MLSVAAALGLCACGAHSPSSAAQTYVSPTVSQSGGTAGPPPDASGVAAPSSSGFSLALRLASGLCMGTDGQGSAKLTRCTGPYVARFAWRNGQLIAPNGQCLDLTGSQAVAGAPLVFTACAPATQSHPTQTFSFDGQGALGLGQASGQCVFAGAGAVQGTIDGLAVGQPLTLGKCSAASLQWTIAPEGTTVRPSADPSQCLQATGNSPQAGANAVLTSCNGSAAQLWTMAGNQLRLQQGSALCLDVNKNVDRGGTGVDLWGCNSASTEAFRLTGADGSLRLQSQPTLCAQATAGGGVVLDACNASTAWTLQAP